MTTRRRQRLAMIGLLFAVAVVAVGARTVESGLNRVAWARSLDPSAPGGMVVRQRGRSDCGLATLEMIFDHYGVGDGAIGRAELDIGPSGIDLLALKRAAEGRGLTTQGLRVSLDALVDVPMPVIAHVHGDHFVVVRSATGDVIVDDPAIGRLRMSDKTFSRAWDGAVLTFGAPNRDDKNREGRHATMTID